MAIVKEVTAVTRYTDAQGNEKKRYHKLGVVMSTRNGDMLKIESVPIGWDGWAYLNDPKDREEVQPKPQGKPSIQPPSNDGFDDSDLPF
jgi:hypothetical protein